MIDKFLLSSTVHVAVGTLVLTITLIAALTTGWLAWRGRELSRRSHVLLIATQLVLMAQALIGIKLLDQGQGVAQLFIHYVGGLAPLLFFSLLYWLPVRRPHMRTRLAAAVAGGAFVFALMTFTIGQAYVRGQI
jgi:heme A synthase